MIVAHCFAHCQLPINEIRARSVLIKFMFTHTHPPMNSLCFYFPHAYTKIDVHPEILHASFIFSLSATQRQPEPHWRSYGICWIKQPLDYCSSQPTLRLLLDKQVGTVCVCVCACYGICVLMLSAKGTLWKLHEIIWGFSLIFFYVFHISQMYPYCRVYVCVKHVCMSFFIQCVSVRVPVSTGWDTASD